MKNYYVELYGQRTRQLYYRSQGLTKTEAERIKASLSQFFDKDMYYVEIYVDE